MAGTSSVGTWFRHTLRVFIGGIFLWAGIEKAINPAAFANAIIQYRLTSEHAAAGLALYLPWLEIAVAAAILSRKLYLGGLALVGLMLTIFVGALASAAYRGLDISCGCFGGNGQREIISALILDISLLAAVMILLADLRRRNA